MITTIILVRHCEAQGNIDRVFNGVSNSDITKNGAIQLEYLSERMKDIQFDYIYSSPLLRAVKTAKACNKYHNLPIHIKNELIEINGGGLENQLFADFPKLYPEQSINWNLKPWLFAIEDGESMVEVYDRMSKTIKSITNSHKGKTILVASHGCAIRNFVCYAKGLPIEELNNITWFENTSITVVKTEDCKNFTVTTENDYNHLPQKCGTLINQTWWNEENRNNLVFE